MNRSVRIVAIVCIAVFAITAIAAAPTLALLDAQTPIDALFWTPAPAHVAVITDEVLPATPVVDGLSPRAPPFA